MLALEVDEVQSVAGGWTARALHGTAPQAVAATYRFTPPRDGGTAVAVRFVGVREDVAGEHGSRDVFDRTESLGGLPTGVGEVSLTARVRGVTAGRWRVVARLVDDMGEAIPHTAPYVVRTETQFHLLATGPGVRLWSWPLLIGLGALVALVLQALLAAAVGVGVVSILALSLLGCLLGFLGGKIWYLGLHRKPLREFLDSGACIQGFLLVSLAALALGSVLLELPTGVVLDITTPGIFLGVAIGRPGCYLTGCCTGRPTASRWGMISSDRRLVVRRIPVQLLEAAAGLVIGLASLAAVLAGLSPGGSIFVAAVAAYTLVRQLLFGLRVESRTRAGRLITIAVSGAVLFGAAALWVT